MRQTSEQERAQFAWKQLTRLRERSEKDKKHDDLGKYKDAVRKFPALVQNNGLGQALSFLLAKGTTKDGRRPDEHEEHGLLYIHLQEWLCRKLLQGGDENDPFRLIYNLVRRDSTTFRHATVEALAIAGWLKRFAEALAPKED